MRMNAKQIALYTGGEFVVDPIDASAVLVGFTWDSREVDPGCLYVALPGEKVDGHIFVEAAIRAGAGGVLVSEKPEEAVCGLARELGVGIIQVPNTYHAISDLAREWRSHLRGKVIALTGSVGKTTTKNLIRDVCASAKSVVATLANQNNELGVPKTILTADPDTQVVIVEMGMRGLGQIAELCRIARPDWGLITNVGDSHLELLGSHENIAHAKAELFEALPNGTSRAFVNAENEYSSLMVDSAKLRSRNVTLVYFGGNAPSDDNSSSPCVWAEDVNIDAEGRPEFTLCAKGFTQISDSSAAPTLFDMEPDVERMRCHMALLGKHNALNACSAAAIGLSLGIPLKSIVETLESSLPEAGRQEVLKARDGYVVINDAYNANPDSMRASLAMFGSMDVSGKRYAVLGDMGELGDFEIACHVGVGRAAASQPLDKLICIGELSKHIEEGALDAGMPSSKIVHVNTIGDVLETLEGNLTSEDAVLVKASHFMELHRVVEGLVN